MTFRIDYQSIKKCLQKKFKTFYLFIYLGFSFHYTIMWCKMKVKRNNCALLHKQQKSFPKNFKIFFFSEKSKKLISRKLYQKRYHFEVPKLLEPHHTSTHAHPSPVSTPHTHPHLCYLSFCFSVVGARVIGSVFGVDCQFAISLYSKWFLIINNSRLTVIFSFFVCFLWCWMYDKLISLNLSHWFM